MAHFDATKRHFPGEPGWEERSPMDRAKLLWPEAAENDAIGGEGDFAVVSRCKIDFGDGPERYDTVTLWGDESLAAKPLAMIDRLGCGGNGCVPTSHFLVNTLTGDWTTGDDSGFA